MALLADQENIMKAKAPFFSLLMFIFLFQIILVSVAGATTRIMPLGDSITQGAGSGVPDGEEEYQVSYRKALWGKLVTAGHDVDFVGSLNSGSELFADADHEGYPGARDDETAAWIYGLLVDHPADIILLHIGTNGIDTDPGDVEDILDEIDRYEFDYNTGITVILARILNRTCCEDIPPCSDCATTTTFNDNVEDMAYFRVYELDNPAYPDKIIFGPDPRLLDD